MRADDDARGRADTDDLHARQRAAVLAEQAPLLAGQEPRYVCVLEVPGASEVYFEELDADGALCGASSAEHPYRLGEAAAVIGAASGLPPGDEWVKRVCAALDWERGARAPDGWRRSRVSVRRGEGSVLHVTAAVNRESIRRHGLDWTRMAVAGGIAGSTEPELPAVFVCDDDLFAASFFLHMARAPSDVWRVSADGLWLENGPDGWWIITEPVAPSRLTLAASDVPAGSRLA
jgi:hypothetical protein